MAYMNYCRYQVEKLPPINCSISLDSNSNSNDLDGVYYYYPGENISGFLKFSCQKDIYISGIRIAVEGRVLVKFKDQFAISITHAREKTILEKTIYVLGDGMKILLLKASKPGTNDTYSFELKLPKNLPCSFKSSYGTIRYQILCYLITRSSTHMKKAEKTFTLNSSFNPILRNPTETNGPILWKKSENSPSVLSSCLTKSDIELSFQAPKNYFIPGSSIPFNLVITNLDGLKSFGELTLFQKIIYRTPGESKNVGKTIAGKRSDLISDTSWADAIEIPSNSIPTNLGLNKKFGIIELQYFLKIEVTLPEISKYFKGEIPIEIVGCGRGYMENEEDRIEDEDSVNSVSLHSPSISNERSIAGSSLINYSELSLATCVSSETLPPSFEEAMKSASIN